MNPLCHGEGDDEAGGTSLDRPVAIITACVTPTTMVLLPIHLSWINLQ